MFGYTWTTKSGHATMKTPQVTQHPIVVRRDTLVSVHVTHSGICNKEKIIVIGAEEDLKVQNPFWWSLKCKLRTLRQINPQD